MRIILIGFMGAGKSSVGRLLAESLNLPLVETDSLVAERAGYPTVAAFVDARGEQVFRDVEAEIVRELRGIDRTVISTGGGIIGREENRQNLVGATGLGEGAVSGRSVVVFLRTSFESARQRIHNGEERPLFRDKVKAYDLFTHRQSIYESWATLTIDTDNISPTDIAQRIVQKISTQYSQLEISAKTKTNTILGDPVAHSLTPAFHNAAYRRLGVASMFVMTACRVEAKDLAEAISGVRALKINGLSVTTPHKQTIIEYLDDLDEDARVIGAVNTVVNRADRLVGYNTDWRGVVGALSEVTTLSATSVLVVGAGGAARAAIYGLKKAGAHVTVMNRTEAKAVTLAKELGVERTSFDKYEKLKEFGVIVNCTSVGMSGALESPLPQYQFNAAQIVFETIYHPRVTPLVASAQAAGCKVILGTSMFFHQALAQIAIHTDLTPDAVVMADDFDAIVG